MINLLELLVKTIGSKLAAVILSACNAVSKAAAYLKYSKERKDRQKKEKTAEDIADNGTLDDLFDFTAKSIVMVSMLSVFGCQNIQIQTTKNWEGHYFSEKDAKQAISSMKLEKKQSVWILSNESMKRILKER